MLETGASGLEINCKGQMKATLMNFSLQCVGRLPKRHLRPQKGPDSGAADLGQRQRQKRRQQTPDSPSQLNLFPFSVRGEDCPHAFILSAADSDVPCSALKPRTRVVSQLCRSSGLVVVFWGGGQGGFYVELPSC